MNALKRYSRTLCCAAGFLAAALVAGCGGGGDQGRDPILGLPAADLVSVAVTPATASVAIGASQKLVATATYTDGSSRDVSVGAAWTSATPAVATVNATSGVAVGVSVGNAVVTAAFSGKSGSSTLTVLPAALVSIAVLPANPSVNIGASQQFSAMGTFSNNTTRDITALSTFRSATTTVATIDAVTGRALGLAAGTSVISATSGALSGSTTLTVNPVTLVSLALTPQAPVLQIGAVRQLTATATFSNGTTADVTSATSFTSSFAGNASVGLANGLVTGVAAGSSVVTASYNGQSATTTATVIANVALTRIVVTPASANVALTGTQQYTATATYSDNSTANVTSTVTWTSSNTAIGTVLNTGVATGVATGTTTITATSGLLSGSASLTVGAAVPPPASAPVNLGRATSFAVLAGTALTNNSGGTTLITGDVGSPSQTTDPTIAGPYTNYKSGAELTNALADLQVAITDANSRTCDVSSASGIDLGGATLSPGVYCYAGSISITGTLTLNGPGVYIFRTQTTLNTTANSIVALNNGATADNVTWVPVGPTTLGANSVFKGSVLGQSAAITVGDNTTLLNGRVLSGAAVTLRNNQITK
ncbi:ice-binding family protein [Massilia sp. TWR1-2-2]|uniref:ice-binding family protein n=1 Tax=Massilia sp. TWR1-2-2 TaxID=2804584 RepID=UPI003CF70AB4